MLCWGSRKISEVRELPCLHSSLASIRLISKLPCANTAPQVGVRRRMSQARALEEPSSHSELQEVKWYRGRAEPASPRRSSPSGRQTPAGNPRKASRSAPRAESVRPESSQCTGRDNGGPGARRRWHRWTGPGVRHGLCPAWGSDWALLLCGLTPAHLVSPPADV